MDQLSAHLERAWDLAQRGDVPGASSSAKRALELDPESPEVHNLLGYVAALEGDCDEAIEEYQQAIALDDTYVEAMLNAAELFVHPMAQYDDALAMCEQVLDLTEYDDEIIDALLLKFEALVAKGDAEEARRALSRLPDGPWENPAQNFLAGRAFFEAGDHERAKGYVEAALESDPKNAEAHYYAGLLCEDRGDIRGACESFLRSRQLELELGMPAWAPNGDAFLLFTQKAIADIAPEARRFLETAELYIADLPGAEVIVDGIDPRSLVLIDAVLLGPEDDGEELAVVPAQVSMRVFLYALNVLRAAAGLHAVQQTIHEALATELKATLAELESEASEVEDAEAERAGEGSGNGAG
jgi:Tfp pilus assembly protein PilF